MPGSHEFDGVKCAKGPLSPMILDILKYASILNATCVKLDNDIESVGTCDKTFNCTGYMGKLNDLGLDMISMPCSINHLRYETEEPPMRLSAITQQYSSAMFSEQGPVSSDELVRVDVMTVTYNLFSKEVVIIYVLWTILVYFIGRIFIRISAKISRRFRVLSYGWNLVQIVFHELYTSPRLFALKQLLFTFIFSYFIFFMFFNCMFNTQYVLSEEGYKIDTLAQLAASNTTACSLKGMNTMDYFNQKEPIHLSILAKHQAATFVCVIDPEPTEIFRLLELIRNHTCTFVAMESAIKSIQRLYCMQCESLKGKPKSHLSKQIFDPSLQSYYMNRNIHDDLFDRVSNTLQHMAESGVIQHTEDMGVEESTTALGLPDSASIRSCIKGETIIPERPQLPLEFENVRHLLKCTLYTWLVAALTLVLEKSAKVFKCGSNKVKKRKRKRKIRMKSKIKTASFVERSILT